MKLFRFHKSFNSVVIGLAQSGNFIPPEIAATMTQQARDYRSADQHLIRLCETAQLRDAGLVATHVSPLVVDLSQWLPESPLDSNIASLYHQTTPDGDAVYQHAEQPLQTRDHQLRRDTFYLPFFQKMNLELDRIVENFGSATVMMLSHSSSLTGCKVTVAADTARIDLSAVIDLASTLEIEIEIEEQKKLPLVIQRAASDQVIVCQLTLSADCFLEEGIWSDRRADRVRELLAEMVSTAAEKE